MRFVRWAATGVTLLVTLLSVTGGAAAKPRTFALTLTVTGSGTIRVSGGRQLVCKATSCKRTFRVTAGAKVALTAQAATDWEFGAWANACKGSSVTCRLRVRKATMAQAMFIAPGERGNPIPLGKAAVVTDDHRLTVLSAKPDATADVLAVTNQFGGHPNDPPPAGAQYFLAAIQVTYTGGGHDDELRYLQQHINSMGAHNAAYIPGDDACSYGGWLPLPVFPEPDELYSGQTAAGNICWRIASNDADSLLLYVEDYPKKTWFSLR